MNLSLDIAHFLAGGMVVLSFLLLYQHRLSNLLDIYALHAVLLGLAVGWQAQLQQAPALYVTAFLALVLKAGVIPMALKQIVRRLNIHREVEQVVGVGLTLLAGIGLTALAVLVMLPVTTHEASFAREDLMFALAIVLLGLLMMTSRRNAVSEIVGFMAMENGLVLAATGAKGMPLVVEISVAFSILIAILVIAIFLFRIRERFDTVDVHALERFRGEGHD
jgi:hydrogenase-4 component E